MKPRRLPSLSCALLAACLALPAFADVHLPGLFGSHMVLQREKPVPVWGWAEPGEAVTVTLGQESAKATADAQGRWKVEFPARKADGKPLRLLVEGKNRIELEDILFGEVWVCSGQSNMGSPVAGCRDGEAEVAAANFPNIRLAKVPYASMQRPPDDTPLGWSPCSPQTVGGFSATAYYFGRKLHRDLRVPVGLILSAKGGTAAELWTPLDALEKLKDYRWQAERARKFLADFPTKAEDDTGWEQPGHPDADWPEMPLPGAWEKSGIAGMEKLDGVVWFRREVELPAEWAGRELEAHFGPIDDGDTTYFNGHPIGSMGTENPNVHQTPRCYPVPAALVKAGKASVALRISDRLGDGGLIGEPAESYLCLKGEADKADGKRISLAGPWRYKIADRWAPEGASTLYNSMVAPLTPVPVRGVLWYQGESNAGHAFQYRELLAGMIESWRAAWGDPAMPFVIVQLPNHKPRQPEPGESPWAMLRESQAVVAKQLPNVALAVTIELGEAKDIHPKNKQDVGARCAAVAEKRWFYQQLALLMPKEAVLRWHQSPDAPQFESMTVEGGKVYVKFSLHGSLETRIIGAEGLPGKIVPKTDTPPAVKGFALAGKDGKFHWATATIANVSKRRDTVVLECPEVPEPVHVRYGWADNPEVNLYDSQSGLPAMPFRTDTFNQ